MRMLRRAAILLGLFAVLAVGVVLIRLGDTLRRDEAVLEWSNVLVSKEFGTTSRPRFLSQAILKEALPNIWVVSGEIALPDTGDGETREGYVAVVRQVCAARREEKCWALQSLALGGEGPAASVAGVSRDGAVTEIQLAPAAETSMDTAVLRDSPQIGASISRSPEMPSGVDVEESVLRTTDEADVAGEKKLIWLTQRALKTLRYDPGPLDGRLGAQTISAIASYQRDYDLAADGRPSHSLLRHMKEGIRHMNDQGAQSILGFNRAYGVGTQQNNLEGYVWLSLAAAQGNPIAEDNRDERSRVMTTQQRSKADLQAANGQREVNARMQSASKAGGPAEPKAAEEEVADLPIEPASETATGAPPKPQVFRVQLGAFKVPENAPAVWQELKRTHPDLLKGLRPDILRVDRGTKGALHLLRVGPLANAQSADELCNSLNERGVDCLVVRNRLKTLGFAAMS